MKFFSAATAVKRGNCPGMVTRIIGVGLLLGALFFLASCNKQDTVDFPSPEAQQPMHWLFDVQGSGADNIWACGNSGTMFHYNGEEWSLVDMGTDKPIDHLYQADDGTFYACGHGGGVWRNTGGGWSAMDSGTDQDLFGLGSYLGNIHVCGAKGVLRRLAGNTWEDTGRNQMIMRDEQNAPTDTLYQNTDIATLLTINQFAIGGAYFDPQYTGLRTGILGTKGMVLSEDNEFDWILRPLFGDPLFKNEWILSSVSDPLVASNNYLGTSEGWLFRLNDDGTWNLMRPKTTLDPHGGIRDIWLDSQQNIYLVTDEGQLIFQTQDYNYVADTGHRTTLMDLPVPFSGIWGTDPGNLYVVGFFEDKIIHASHNQSSGDFTWEEIPVVFPDKSGDRVSVDQFGQPVFSPGLPVR